MHLGNKWKENFSRQAADLLDSRCARLRLDSQKQSQNLKLYGGDGGCIFQPIEWILFQYNEVSPGENTIEPLQIDFTDAFSLLCKQWSPKVDTTQWDVGKERQCNSHINAGLDGCEIP